MSYAICRVQKCGSSHDVAGMQIHDRRERKHSNSNPDIDFSRSKENYSLCSLDGSFNEFIDKQIAERYTGKKAVRKDAVRMVQVLFTSDNEFFAKLSSEQQREYFQSCYKWAADRWGAANIISANVHMDEVTPHMHLNFVPLTKDGRLSAKECVGNGSKALQQLQDNFYQVVGAAHGLERGSRSDLENGDQPRKNQRVSEYKNRTEYYKQQEDALKTNVQALQGTLDDLNDILQAEPQNAIEGISVPLSKGKRIISTSDIATLNEVARAVTVKAAEQELYSQHLSEKEITLNKERAALDIEQEKSKMENVLIKKKTLELDKQLEEVDRLKYKYNINIQVKDMQSKVWYHEQVTKENTVIIKELKNDKTQNLSKIEELKQDNDYLKKQIIAIREPLELERDALEYKVKELQEENQALKNELNLYKAEELQQESNWKANISKTNGVEIYITDSERSAKCYLYTAKPGNEDITYLYIKSIHDDRLKPLSTADKKRLNTTADYITNLDFYKIIEKNLGSQQNIIDKKSLDLDKSR